MKNHKKMIGVIIGCMVVIGIVGYSWMMKVVNNANNLPISLIDVSTIKNGTYVGTYEISPVQVEVSVTIEQHHITSIKLLNHFHGLGKKGEDICDEVVKQQSLDVDVISGATVSSKCILKAIEQAMLKENINE